MENLKFDRKMKSNIDQGQKIKNHVKIWVGKSTL